MSQHQQLFNQYDADHNSGMDLQEFKQFMQKSGINLNDQQLESNFRYYDNDNDGIISVEEFKKHVHFKTAVAPVTQVRTVAPVRTSVQSRRGTTVTVESLFSQYAGQKGHLNGQDLQRFFADSGSNLSDQEVPTQLKYIGAQNGQVNLQSFKQFVQNDNNRRF